MRFITREDTERIIEACPNVHWRTIVALARLWRLAVPIGSLVVEMGRHRLASGPDAGGFAQD
jgi:hypothetical protein